MKRKVWLIPAAVLGLLLGVLLYLQPWRTFTIVLGGDVMLSRNGRAILSDASSFGAALPTLQQADLVLANLESPLGDTDPTRYILSKYDLCADPNFAQDLAAAGFTAFSIANNHRLDCGHLGYLQTEKWLDTQGIKAFGGEKTAIFFKIKGQMVTILAYDDVLQPLDPVQVLSDVNTYRSKTDFLIVSLHWGNEYQGGPDTQQEQLAQKLADAGVDVIWGHHPHVLQRMEYLENSTHSHQTLVIYSLGNLFSDQAMLPDAQREALVQLTIRASKVTGVKVIPLKMVFQPNTLVTPEDITEGLIFDRLKWPKDH